MQDGVWKELSLREWLDISSTDVRHTCNLLCTALCRSHPGCAALLLHAPHLQALHTACQNSTKHALLCQHWCLIWHCWSHEADAPNLQERYSHPFTAVMRAQAMAFYFNHVSPGVACPKSLPVGRLRSPAALLYIHAHHFHGIWC